MLHLRIANILPFLIETTFTFQANTNLVPSKSNAAVKNTLNSKYLKRKTLIDDLYTLTAKSIKNITQKRKLITIKLSLMT